MLASYESPTYLRYHNKELLSVNLEQSPAFCFQYPDATKITMKDFIAQVNGLRDDGIICNPAYPYIVGFVRTAADFEQIHRLQNVRNGILGIGAPMIGGFSDIVINKKEKELDIGGPALIASVRLVQTMHKNGQQGIKYGRLDPKATWEERKNTYKNSNVKNLTKQEVENNLNVSLDHDTKEAKLISKYLKKKLAVINYVEARPIHTFAHDLVGSTDISQLPVWPEVHVVLVAYFNKLRKELRSLSFSDDILFSPFDYPLTESMNILLFTAQANQGRPDRIEEQTQDVDKKISISDAFLQKQIQKINQQLHTTIPLVFITKPQTFYPTKSTTLVVPTNPFDYTPLNLPKHFTDEQLQREEKDPDFEGVVRR